MPEPIENTPETPQQTAEAPEQPDTGNEPTPTPPADEAAKWKALARKHEEQAKANADKAKRFDALEEASKTEQQKAHERAEAAEKKLAEITLRATRLEVAAEKGVPADLLAGTTAEEMAASADRLLAFRGESKSPAAPSANGQGNVGKPVGTGDKQLTRDDLKGMTPQAIDAARESGLLSNLLGQ